MLPLIEWESYKNELITESIIGYLSRKIDVNNACHWAPLLFACLYQPSVVQLLIENGANVNAIDRGRRFLSLACEYQPSVVQLLIENGANVNSTDNSG